MSKGKQYIRRKMGVLEYAKKIGNVSKACRPLSDVLRPSICFLATGIVRLTEGRTRTCWMMIHLDRVNLTVPEAEPAVSGGGELLPQGEIIQHQRLSREREGANPPEGELEKEKHRRKMRAPLCNGKQRSGEAVAF